jgi:precorrin-2/cobalt-factor-2 C20-methyltransferase
MDKDAAKRRKARQIAAADLIKKLNNGKNVGFVTLGDPTTYSTYMYVHEIIMNDGFEAEIIPGITSYTAAAAALGISLCEGDEILTIIPASHSESIDELLNYPGNKVIMKSGDNLLRVLERLKKRGFGDKTKIAYRATMDGQQLYANIEDYEKSPETGYFTTAIIKEKA